MKEMLEQASRGDHLVHLYQDQNSLAEVVAEYLAAGLRKGEAAVIIATPPHRRALLRELERAGFRPGPALVVLDAEQTLARFMSGGQPQWKPFHEVVGGLIAELRLHGSGVRAYGEMVDVLWQRDQRDAATLLEEYWNELGRLQTFSLLCAYFMDPLDEQAYRGPLECVCKTHTHLLPARDYARFNDAVAAASQAVLDQPLAQMLLSLATNHQPATHMPVGQATLIWLGRNMPRTAEKILKKARGLYAADAASA
jgi:hypothetical protein